MLNWLRDVMETVWPLCFGLANLIFVLSLFSFHRLPHNPADVRRYRPRLRADCRDEIEELRVEQKDCYRTGCRLFGWAAGLAVLGFWCLYVLVRWFHYSL